LTTCASTSPEIPETANSTNAFTRRWVDAHGDRGCDPPGRQPL